MGEKQAPWIAKDADGERVLFLDGEPLWEDAEVGGGWWEHTGKYFTDEDFYGKRAFAEPLFDMLPWDDIEAGQAMPVPFLVQQSEIITGGDDA